MTIPNVTFSSALTPAERQLIEKHLMVNMAGLCAIRRRVKPEGHESSHVILALAADVPVRGVTVKRDALKGDGRQGPHTKIDPPAMSKQITVYRNCRRRVTDKSSDFKSVVYWARILNPEADWKQLHRYLRIRYARTVQILGRRENIARGVVLTRALELLQELDERQILALVALGDMLLFMGIGSTAAILRGDFDQKILETADSGQQKGND